MKKILCSVFITSLSLVVFSQKTHIGNWSSSSLNDLFVLGDYAYCIGNDSLFTLNISDPTNISLSDKQFVESSEICGNNDYLVLGEADSVFIYSISNLHKPSRISGLSVLDYQGFSPEPDDAEIKAISIQENALFVLTVYNIGWNTEPDLLSIDISNIYSPTISNVTYLGSGAQRSRVDDMIVNNDTAYIIDGYDMGLQIFDVSDNSSISKIGSNPAIIQLGESIFHIETNSNNIFITTHELNELKICDKSGTIIGTYTFNISEEKRLIAVDNYIYVVSKSGIELIDVNNINQAQKVDYYSTYNNLNSITSDNQYIYVASDNGIYVFEQYKITNSVVDLDKEVAPSISPNPAQDFINIEFKNTGSFEITIINLQGKTLFHKKVIETTSNIKIDISSYINGLYIVEIKSRVQIFKRKLIKN